MRVISLEEFFLFYHTHLRWCHPVGLEKAVMFRKQCHIHKEVQQELAPKRRGPLPFHSLAKKSVLGSCIAKFPYCLFALHHFSEMLQVRSLQSLFVLYLLRIYYLAMKKKNLTYMYQLDILLPHVFIIHRKVDSLCMGQGKRSRTIGWK